MGVISRELFLKYVKFVSAARKQPPTASNLGVSHQEMGWELR